MICIKCNEKIKSNEKAVLLKTFEGKKTIEDVYFHFSCYLKWIDENLESKALKLFNKTMNKTLQNFGMVMGKNNEETNKSNLQKVWIS